MDLIENALYTVYVIDPKLYIVMKGFWGALTLPLLQMDFFFKLKLVFCNFIGGSSHLCVVGSLHVCC